MPSSRWVRALYDLNSVVKFWTFFYSCFSSLPHRLIGTLLAGSERPLGYESEVSNNAKTHLLWVFLSTAAGFLSPHRCRPAVLQLGVRLACHSSQTFLSYSCVAIERSAFLVGTSTPLSKRIPSFSPSSAGEESPCKFPRTPPTFFFFFTFFFGDSFVRVRSGPLEFAYLSFQAPAVRLHKKKTYFSF